MCQEGKSPPNKNIAPLTSIDTGQGPFEQIALDILKLPFTARHNQYLLVVEDFFSTWVEAFPLKRTAEPSVAQCILNGWVSRFGCPYTILTDQGPEFESNLFRCLNNMLQTRKLRTTTYHPRTDGMVERSNRTLIDIFSKYGEETPDWDLKLPLLLFAIRTSEHTTTGFSPFALTYGREARLPWDIVYGPAPNTPTPHKEWVAERKHHMTKVFQMVKDITKQRQLHQKEYFDKQRSGKFHKFEVGDLVMRCDPAARSKRGKLNRPWSGPHKIVGKVSDSLYKLEVSPGVETVFNAERLKVYFPRAGEPSRAERVEGVEEEEELSDEEEYEVEENNIPDPPAPIREEAHQLQLQGRQQEPIMGARGQLWCNIDPQNIAGWGRRHVQ